MGVPFAERGLPGRIDDALSLCEQQLSCEDPSDPATLPLGKEYYFKIANSVFGAILSYKVDFFDANTLESTKISYRNVPDMRVIRVIQEVGKWRQCASCVEKDSRLKDDYSDCKPLLSGVVNARAARYLVEILAGREGQAIERFGPEERKMLRKIDDFTAESVEGLSKLLKEKGQDYEIGFIDCLLTSGNPWLIAEGLFMVEPEKAVALRGALKHAANDKGLPDNLRFQAEILIFQGREAKS